MDIICCRCVLQSPSATRPSAILRRTSIRNGRSSACTRAASDPASSPDWKGRTGLVGHAVLEDFADLGNVTVYVSGGPAMVYATLDAFVERGMPEDRMHSDIFSYAPRDK